MKKYFNLNSLVLVVSIIFFALLFVYHLKVVSNPYQNELREGAVEMFSDALINKVDVFSVINQPLLTNVYGILYNLILIPFYLVFGPSLIVGRVISLIFILASSYLIYIACRKIKLSKEYSFAAFVFFYACTLELGNTMFVRPDSLGIFLMLLSFILPWIKDFSRKSLIISVVVTFLAFITKPYYIAGMGYLLLYIFLFVNKKKAIVYGILNGVILGSTFLLIYKFIPLYYNNVFYVNAVSAGNDITWMLLQFREYLIYNLALITILLLSTIYFIYRLIFRKTEINLKLKFNFFNLNRPLLFSSTELIFLMSAVISILMVLFKLGRHTGAYMTYLYQLISPFLIIFIFQLIKKIEKNTIMNTLCAILIIINFFIGNTFQYTTYNSYEDFSSGWKQISEIIKTHNNILNTPAVGSIMVEQNKKIYDSGQTQFNYFSNRTFSSKYNEYIAELNNKIVTKEFDVILLARSYSPLADLNLVDQYYDYKETIPLVMPYSGQTWMISVWEPKFD